MIEPSSFGAFAIGSNTFVIIEAVDVSLPALLRLRPQFALRTGQPATAELVFN
ncbi:hypothetical protein [Bradyrhizobium sp. 15]|uniref:hypothetical protein n=1 Tax=Bradyrhizobium sp. 15 TaxID=2782633 RepID=UPI001FF9E766|nr:hypothetical protein [Bradyrhizobium sp. 15]MCK1440686.1 hypothetical protein [Bradyrhizobium sp. 15]